MIHASPNPPSAPLVEAQNLCKYFPVRARFFGKSRHLLKAVDGVSFAIEKGETFGLVGESGCGKTTVGRTLVRLYEPTAGAIRYDGQDISHLNRAALLPFRRRAQMIFQDPYASLDPRMTVGDIIAEPLRVQNLYPGKARDARARELLALVGLKPDHINRYPHEFSGGQRQRIGLARALAGNPEFIVCDEPISALDVSIQAQVVNMLEALQDQFGLTYLFVSHDLTMVRHISRRVAVMYLGAIVELAPVAVLYKHMQHPYTQALLSAAPVADPRRAAQAARIPLQGDVPTPIDPPPGCLFRGRCPKAVPRCAQERPALRDLGGGHLCACHLLE
ncbi:MAG: ATP-binding cassette domain-containing protein [Oscillospiraceae bacterium]|jgi:oligopeptide transport system ATP-binding protein|nr:ATP-binding cassette domain-containing protein [Oscillospiraceae bacterium]